jgi:hypothetical protein
VVHSDQWNHQDGEGGGDVNQPVAVVHSDQLIHRAGVRA